MEKQDSKVICGVAILLMVAHHLFGFPDRIMGTVVPDFYTNIGKIFVFIGYYGKICVGLYAFISGFGMNKKCSSLKFFDTCKKTIHQILNFYSRYWMVLVIFLVIGIVIQKREFVLIEFIKNVIGITCSYNDEWWYVYVYLKMMLTFPIVNLLLKMCERNNKVSSVVLIFSFVILIALNLFIFNGNILYFLCFWMGMVFAEFDILNYILNFADTIKMIFSLVLLFLSILLKFTISLDNKLDFIVIIPLITGVILLVNNKLFPSVLRKVLQQLGKYSIYIWLTHTFFIYYYFQDIVLKLKFLPIIYITTILVCYICAVILDKIHNGLLKVLKVR